MTEEEELLKKYYSQNRDINISCLHNDTGGTAVQYPLGEGEFFSISITKTLETNMRFKNAAKMDYSIYNGIQFEGMEEPLKDAPRDAWCTYYAWCKDHGKKISHKIIAEKIGISESRWKHIYLDWKGRVAPK